MKLSFFHFILLSQYFLIDYRKIVTLIYFVHSIDLHKPRYSFALTIPAKPLQNHDIVSVHFNHFYCTDICDKLSRVLDMLTYIYLKVGDC